MLVSRAHRVSQSMKWWTAKEKDGDNARGCWSSARCWPWLLTKYASQQMACTRGRTWLTCPNIPPWYSTFSRATDAVLLIWIPQETI